VGSIVGESTGRSGERGRSGRGETPGEPRPSEATSALRSRFDGLLGEGPQVAPVLFETVEDLDAGDRLARHQGDQEGFDRSSSTRPRTSRTLSAVRVPESVDRSWSSIDSASRMPPAAQARNQVDCFGLGSATIGIEDHLQLAGQSRGTVRRRKSNRWTRDRTAGRMPLLSRGAEDEDRVVRAAPRES